MELKTLAATGKKFGDYYILPLTLKECAEIQPDDINVLMEGWIWICNDPEKVTVFDKWITRKVRDAEGNAVTIQQLVDKDYPVSWLHWLVLELLQSSGFPLPEGVNL